MIKPYTLSRLSKISPKWAELLKDMDKNNLQIIETIRDPECCIVGEAHLYNDDYIATCKDCRIFAFSLLMFYDMYEIKNNENTFEGQIKEFIKHFRKAHQKQKEEQEQEQKERPLTSQDFNMNNYKW